MVVGVVVREKEVQLDAESIRANLVPALRSAILVTTGITTPREATEILRFCLKSHIGTLGTRVQQIRSDSWRFH